MQTNQTFAPEANPSNYMEQMVGEGKKYATVDDAMKGLFNANQHIEKIETENSSFRQELATRQTVEDLLSKNSVPPVQAPAIENNPKPTEETPKVSEVPSEKDLSELVKAALQEQNSEALKSRNFNEATTTLDKIFGSRQATNEAVSKRASELGVSVDMLVDAAKQSPSSLYALMGVSGDSKTKPVSSAPVSADINVETLKTQNASSQIQEGTYAYYQALRKSDPQLYAKRETEMFKLSQEDPDKFFGRS